MSDFNIFSLITAKKKLILLTTLVFVVIAMAASLLQPLRYTSSLKLLVVQKAGANADAYALSKSNDYLSQLLAKVSYSNLFLGRVLASDTSIDSAYFGTTVKQRAKNWDKAISVKSLKETGIITIEAYQPNRDQAEKIARAIALTLMTQHANYHGMGDNVMIRLLDEPITSTYPDQPNLLVNFLVALVAGLAFGIAWAYLQAPQVKAQAPVENYQHAYDQHYAEAPAAIQEIAAEAVEDLEDTMNPEPGPMPEERTNFPWKQE